MIPGKTHGLQSGCSGKAVQKRLGLRVAEAVFQFGKGAAKFLHVGGNIFALQAGGDQGASLPNSASPNPKRVISLMPMRSAPEAVKPSSSGVA